MDLSINFATRDDAEELRNILLEAGMDLEGNIEDHVVVQRGTKILAVALVQQIDENFFHLVTMATRKDERNSGIGSRLLRDVTLTPWQYCRNTAEITHGSYQVTTVARGEAAPFYIRCGYQIYNFSSLADAFALQCQECSDYQTCNPVSLVFQGVTPGSRRR